MRTIEIYDSTLRDGEQGENISFSLDDKIRIAHLLDDFGVHYIEGGWPGSNPKAVDFFEAMKTIKLRTSVLTAFGSTRLKNTKAEDDSNLRLLIASGVSTIAIFGKSWDLHVTQALGTTLDENLRMIADSVKFLKKKGREVVYDAEHFFDGFKRNPDYCLDTLEAAASSGARIVVLCDTNGGTMPTEMAAIVAAVQKRINVPLGIHTHNDSGMAVANAITAVSLGAIQVQGTMNGFGERTGNCDLVQVMPNLEIKYGCKTVKQKDLTGLSRLSHEIAEIANLPPDPRQPYVGRSNFAHKGGIHVSAVLRNPACYEHIEPEVVGNERRVLVSEMSGKSNLLYKIMERGMEANGSADETQKALNSIKQLENEGYQFEAAEASVEVLMAKSRGDWKPRFGLHGWRTIVERREGDGEPLSEATVRLDIDGQMYHAAALGDGPVNALDGALRRALAHKYPEIQNIRLTDYKVRIIGSQAGTAARIRVLITSSDGQEEWSTVGVSENIIEASWRALVDSIEYRMMKDDRQRAAKKIGEPSASPKAAAKPAAKKTQAAPAGNARKPAKARAK